MSPVLSWPRFRGCGTLLITPLEGRVGLCLCGDGDLTSAAALRQALAALPPQADPIHLQLAALEFADVAATRELAALARRSARPVVILHDPPPVLIRVLRLLWPDTLDRFQINDGPAAPAVPAADGPP